jgi:hypothetical protein
LKQQASVGSQGFSWPSKIRAGKGCFFSGTENFALKKISAGRRPVSAMSAMPRVV